MYFYTQSAKLAMHIHLHTYNLTVEVSTLSVLPFSRKKNGKILFDSPMWFYKTQYKIKTEEMTDN